MEPDSTLATQPDEAAFTVADDFAGIRGFVRDRAVAAGLSTARAEMLMLAVSELMSNTIEHTGGGGVVRVWAEAGAVVCEVRDQRPGGWRPASAVMPAADAIRGRGMAIVSRVCDAVSVDGDGSVQLRMMC
ncbi:ATP-binding protein [Catellatospora sp. NPDC049111]|uniref:ATP-binding protein n=1 Tax=Catellatospora sp. NPDC049111 TaxID=3155271 RepID=UPI0033C9320E